MVQVLPVCAQLWQADGSWYQNLLQAATAQRCVLTYWRAAACRIS